MMMTGEQFDLRAPLRQPCYYCCKTLDEIFTSWTTYY